MSGPFGSSQFMYATGVAVEGQSLRFEDGDSAYLSWTPASAGNRKTWTWSGWVKRGNLTNFHSFFSAYSSGTSLDYIFFNNNDTLAFRNYNGTSYDLITNAVFRDPSAWYHIVLSVDTTQTTSSDRVKVYVNGETQSLGTATYPSQNYDFLVNSTVAHYIGYNGYNYHDGYLANVAFIDGTALDPTSFGEYDGTLWRPKSDTAIQALTFGTNGFYLPFKQTTEAEGFSTVTYSGNGGTQSIEGVGFEPDFVWVKKRSGTENHELVDSVRGVTKRLQSNVTNAENTGGFTSFDSSGFTLSGGYGTDNENGNNYVAWCWDAGTGSAASNTDGTITSTVKANTAKGFSIVSYTGNGSSSPYPSVGHGLTSTPEIIFCKTRDASANWIVYHTLVDGSLDYLNLNTASANNNAAPSLPTSSIFYAGGDANRSGEDTIAYCFHSVSGYSSIGSYTGNGSTTGPTVTTGFPVAFVLIKRTDVTDNWIIYDTTRSPVNPADKGLFPNDSSQELTGNDIDFNASNFQIKTSDNGFNASGGTYIYMAFKDTRDATFFGDTSGNSNNWTPNALNNTDVVPDSPVTGGNFCTWNSLSNGTGTLSEGNLKLSGTATATARTNSTISVSSGKWYFETHLTASQTYTTVGIGQTSATNQNVGQTSTSYGFIFEQAQKINSNTTASYGNTLATGDVFMCAFDLDNNELFFGKNGTWFNSSDPATNTSPAYSISNGSYHVMARPYNASSVITANFGQDSSFAGNATPQGNTDDNGVGDFQYAPPSGFLALATSNLPLPAITAPDEYFNTVLWTGNASDRDITGVGFSPDWVWVKNRSNAYHHGLFDSVRGANKVLKSSDTSAEATFTEQLTSFNADGFSVGDNSDSGNYVNISGHTYVAWNWLAGNGTVSNTDGSITSTVSANTDAGFSIVTYDSSPAGTVGHGLSQAPELIIEKKRDATSDWIVSTTVIDGSYDFLRLNTTTAKANAVVAAPTSTVFTHNVGSDSVVAYCFHSVESYSKIGSFTGNGSSDGTYVQLGFSPSWIMMKRSDGGSNWWVWDSKRNPHNLSSTILYPDISNAEFSNPSYFAIDMTASGFKIRQTIGSYNASGGSYIFLAFAEAPFSKANAR